MALNSDTNIALVAQYLGYPASSEAINTTIKPALDAIVSGFPTYATNIETQIAKITKMRYYLDDDYFGAVRVPHVPQYYLVRVHMLRLQYELKAMTAIPFSDEIWNVKDLAELAQVATPITTPMVSLPLDPFCNILVAPTSAATAPVNPAMGQVWIDTSVSPSRKWQWDGAWWVGITSSGASQNRFEGDIKFKSSITATGVPVATWIKGKAWSGSPQGIWVGQVSSVILYDNGQTNTNAGVTAYAAFGLCNTGATDGVVGTRLPTSQITERNTTLQPLALTTPSLIATDAQLAVTQSAQYTTAGSAISGLGEPTREGAAPTLAAEDRSYITGTDRPYLEVELANTTPTSLTNFGVLIDSTGTTGQVLQISGSVHFSWAQIIGGV